MGGEAVDGGTLQIINLLVTSGVLAATAGLAFSAGKIVSKVDDTRAEFNQRLVEAEKIEQLKSIATDRQFLAVRERIEGLHTKMDAVNGATRDHGQKLAQIWGVCPKLPPGNSSE